jgi:hypothetical protein
VELKSLSDLVLVSEVKILVKKEQSLTLEILKYLREIELRRLRKGRRRRRRALA